MAALCFVPFTPLPRAFPIHIDLIRVVNPFFRFRFMPSLMSRLFFSSFAVTVARLNNRVFSSLCSLHFEKKRNPITACFASIGRAGKPVPAVRCHGPNGCCKDLAQFRYHPVDLRRICPFVRYPFDYFSNHWGKQRALTHTHTHTNVV